MPSLRMIFRLDHGRAFGLSVVVGVAVGSTVSAWAQTTAFQPSAAQPVLPSGGSKPTSPVVESLMDQATPILEVRKTHGHARYEMRRHHRHVARPRLGPPAHDLERPALAGVELLRPLPLPGQPPHIAVPVPGYPLDNFITAYTMPPPPIVCRPTRRDPYAPDPRLYREHTVACEADNP